MSVDLTGTFITDQDFMEWLEHYNDIPYEQFNPNWWRSEHSGTIKGMHDAWRAGRAGAANVREKSMSTKLDLTFEELSSKNLLRCESEQGFSHRLDSWTPAEWSNAMAGEFGEFFAEFAKLLLVCNTTKKISRQENDIRGNKDADSDVEELRKRACRELADIILYADLAIQRLGGNTGSVVREVWNSKSDQIGFPARI